jgi:dienelactone hydrolase
MQIMMKGRALALIVALAIAGGAAFIARPYVHGLSFVIRAANMQGAWRRAADVDTGSISRRELEIPTEQGPLRARLYQPLRRVRRTALLVSGLHPSGIEEPRLVALATELSSSGIAVVTPDIPDLSRFAITPAITDAIEQAASWLAAQPEFAPDGRIGMMGISFSGGLSIVAAGRPALQGRVAYVFSFGGHADLPRVLRYLCTGLEPAVPDSASPLNALRAAPDASSAGESRFAEAPPPHDYGVAVILLGVADRLVPPPQVAALRDAVRRFLLASALDSVDKSKAQPEFQALREAAKTMPEPSATLLRYVNDRDVVHLGSRLVPWIGLYGDAPALSAARSPKPAAPVFLLHGTEDNVIPAAESMHLAAQLRGVTPVRVLLSGLISHAEADRPAHFGDVMELASFWGDLLSR